jgi:2-hydroxycyclohexanecarboxyl-CoA dehydrogenase
LNFAEGRLHGKVAIVTGGGRGIGRGVALRLAKEGANVVVANRTESRAERVAEEIRATGGTALAVGCDVGEEQQVKAMAARALAEFGTVHILVNNAQSLTGGGDVNERRAIEEFTDDEWMDTLRSGFFGTIYCSRAVVPAMKAQNYGKIINFGSSTGVFGLPYLAPYNCTKEAIRGLTKTAAAEWGPFGIRVNVICPTLETDLMAAARAVQSEGASSAAGAGDIPLGYVGDPERDGGALVAFLASEDGDYMSGNTLFLAGGRHFLP